jgi:hypothetical protein
MNEDRHATSSEQHLPEPPLVSKLRVRWSADQAQIDLYAASSESPSAPVGRLLMSARLLDALRQALSAPHDDAVVFVELPADAEAARRQRALDCLEQTFGLWGADDFDDDAHESALRADLERMDELHGWGALGASDEDSA